MNESSPTILDPAKSTAPVTGEKLRLIGVAGVFDHTGRGDVSAIEGVAEFDEPRQSGGDSTSDAETGNRVRVGGEGIAEIDEGFLRHPFNGGTGIPAAIVFPREFSSNQVRREAGSVAQRAPRFVATKVPARIRQILAKGLKTPRGRRTDQQDFSWRLGARNPGVGFRGLFRISDGVAEVAHRSGEKVLFTAAGNDISCA